MTRRLPSRPLVRVGLAAMLSLSVDAFSPSPLFARGEVHGIREFSDSTTWRVPAGVTHIIVELWGAGGGGGPGTSASWAELKARVVAAEVGVLAGT